MSNFFLSLIALLVIFVAVYMLSRKRLRSYRTVSVLLVGLLSLAFFIYSIQYGVEFGGTYGFIALYASAMGVVVLSRIQKNKKNKPVKKIPVNPPTSLWRYKILRFVCAGLLSGLLSAFLCVGFCRLLPIDTINQLVLAAFLYPLFWVALAFFCCRFQITKAAKPVLEMAA